MTARSILITGCSSGIGLASARLMKANGWRVFATARKPEDVERLARVEAVEALQLDLTEPSSIARCADEVLRRTDAGIYALFNNAGYGQTGAVEDITPEVLRLQLEVNLIGAHDLTRRLLPTMRRNGRGRIVQCSSVLGFVSGAYRGAYCASKYGLEALSDAMRLELHGTGVFVSIIEPGPIETRFVDNVIAAFDRNVDEAASAYRTGYEHRRKEMQAGKRGLFKLGPEAVAAKLRHAVESRRPKIRYRVTLPTHMAALMKRALPDRLIDRFMASA